MWDLTTSTSASVHGLYAAILMESPFFGMDHQDVSSTKILKLQARSFPRLWQHTSLRKRKRSHSRQCRDSSSQAGHAASGAESGEPSSHPPIARTCCSTIFRLTRVSPPSSSTLASSLSPSSGTNSTSSASLCWGFKKEFSTARIYWLSSSSPRCHLR